MEHSKYCTANKERTDKLRAAFVALWPNYCPDCVGKNNCPRCGQSALNEEGTECSACDWQYDEDDDNMGHPNFIPEPHECYCMYTQEYEPCQ